MGRNRRRRDGQRPAPPSGWRATVDSFGGLPAVGLVAAVLVVVGLLIYLNRPGSSVNDAPYVPVERAQTDGRIEGDPDAPIRIIAWEDFQCPFCARFSTEIEPLLREEFVDTGIASFEFRHLAFLGAESVRAAEASECANEQGSFWDYHDILFLRQGDENAGVYSDANLKRFASQMAEALPDRPWDRSAFESCLDSGSMRLVVEEMTAEARELDVRSTPSFWVNGRLIRGSQSIDDWRALIAELRE